MVTPSIPPTVIAGIALGLGVGAFNHLLLVYALRRSAGAETKRGQALIARAYIIRLAIIIIVLYLARRDVVFLTATGISMTVPANAIALLTIARKGGKRKP